MRCLLLLISVFSPLCLVGAEKTQKETPSVPDTKVQEVDDLRVLLLVGRGTEKAGVAGDKEKTSQALAVYRKIVEFGAKGKTRREALFGAGRCEIRLGNYWKAFVALEESFPRRLDPQGVAERVRLQVSIGRHFASLKDAEVAAAGKGMTGYRCAARVLQAAVYNDPRNDEADESLLLLGHCFEQLHDLPGAEMAYRRFLRDFDHGKALAKASLARILTQKPYSSGLPQKVIDEIKGLITDCKLEREQSAELKKRIVAAEKAVAERMAGDRLSRAEYYLRSRRTRKSGMFHLRELVRLYPDTTGAVRARELLKKYGVSEKEDQK